MNGWNDYLMKQEQYRDQIREAERQRLIKLAKDCHPSSLGQAIRNLASGVRRRKPATGRVPCGEGQRLLEKAA